ncbi:hypothetical protein Adt_31050 [Abeliophyllum distichum]|uniref:Uncharacterized protein n=1 Tax=Abeliophyllum distichum TaxID=126358 RepID=A0ABD1RGH8_9LAMI
MASAPSRKLECLRQVGEDDDADDRAALKEAASKFDAAASGDCRVEVNGKSHIYVSATLVKPKVIRETSMNGNCKNEEIDKEGFWFAASKGWSLAPRTDLEKTSGETDFGDSAMDDNANRNVDSTKTT